MSGNQPGEKEATDGKLDQEHVQCMQPPGRENEARRPKDEEGEEVERWLIAEQCIRLDSLDSRDGELKKMLLCRVLIDML
jgi:hypothetical protein